MSSCDAPFWMVGAAKVSMIRESEGLGSAPTTLFPDFRCDAFDAAHAMLDGDIHDAGADRLKISFHSWLIEIERVRVLVDPCAGNGKKRPNNPRPGWNSRYCELPQLAQATRMAVLERAVRSGAIIFSSHFPGREAGFVRRSARGFRFSPLQPQNFGAA